MRQLGPRAAWGRCLQREGNRRGPAHRSEYIQVRLARAPGAGCDLVLEIPGNVFKVLSQRPGTTPLRAVADPILRQCRKRSLGACLAQPRRVRCETARC